MREQVSETLVAVDIGNTKIALGFFRKRALLGCLRFPSELTAARLERELRKAVPAERQYFRGCPVAVSSVVPAVNRRAGGVLRRVFGSKPYFIGHKDIPVRSLYLRPSDAGIDRMLNVLAGFEFFGGPAVVVDAGTAITFSCITAKREFLGGLILPGMGMAARALAEHTAKLPLLRVREPETVIGRSTAECMNAGIYYGTAGAVNAILDGLAEKCGKKMRVILTGGGAHLLMRGIKRDCKCIEDLTLSGIELVCRKRGKAFLHFQK